MKKLLMAIFAAFAFAACTQNDVEELAANRADVPETLTVGFEGSDTRIQLNEALKTVWNAGDEVSVFYKSYDNLKYQFEGNTGDRSGMLSQVGGDFTGQTMDEIIIIYPYSSDYLISFSSKAILVTLPATQNYEDGSYGKGGNIMVAASEFSAFTLKSICGWLRIDLTGEGQKVRKISLQGNREEQIAGLVYVDAESAEVTFPGVVGGYDDVENSVGGGLDFASATYTEITLNCGEGVELGAEAKSFYIGVLPQTFEGGVTVTIECSDGSTKTIGTTEALTIERNHIKPINGGKYDGKLPEVYELAYRTNDGKKLDPLTTNGFGSDFKDNIFDASTGNGKLVFDGAITAIPDQAFGLCENLTWIDLPLGITTIGESSFNGCSSMVEITIPASVTFVGSEAFKGCTGKAYVNCSGVSFSHALFSEVIIGNSVTSIEDAAFRYCDSLTTVIIGDSVTTIGWAAFDNCKRLSTVIFGDSLTKVGGYAFASCESLASVTFPDSLTIIDDYAFHICSGLVNITIPDSVTTIGMGAFSNCHNLISVTISACVTTIRYAAFAWNSSLTSVYCRAATPTAGDSYSCLFDDNAPGRIIYVPMDSVRRYKTAAGWSEYADSIVGYDFEAEDEVASQNRKIHYAALAKIESHTDSPWTFETFGANIVSHEWDDVMCEGVITFDADVTTIGDKAFYYASNLTSITIPESVVTIGESAFQYCYGLTEITLPDSVTTIADYAFYYCDGSASINIGNSVTSIGRAAFTYCTSLTVFTIPESVKTIGQEAFDFCSNLATVYCKPTNPPLGDYKMFSNTSPNLIIYVPLGSQVSYRDWSKYWCDYADVIVGYNYYTGEVEE